MTKKTINDYLKEAGLDPAEATWEMKKKDKSGKEIIRTIVLHKALEDIKTHLGMEFERPTIINADYKTKQTGTTTWGKAIMTDDSHISMIIVGSWGDQTEWTTGEYSPANSANDYPWAIAEKRGKDRVILKLLGVHGEVYSEIEAEAFSKKKIKEESEKPKAPYVPYNKVSYQNNNMKIYVPQTDVEGPDF